MLVQQRELRIDVSLDGKLMQDTRTKTVNRRDTSAFQRALVTQPAPAFVSSCLFEEIVDLFAHTLAHFVGGAIRESNRYDVIDGDFPGAQNFQIALNQHQRLAGTWPGSDGKVTVESMRGDLLFGLQFARH